MAAIYPWYAVVEDDSLEQGDILDRCPVFIPGQLPEEISDEDEPSPMLWEDRDVIVMSQTCDMVRGREKISDVLLCPIWKRDDYNEPGNLFADLNVLEQIRKGSRPAYFLLNTCNIDGYNDLGFRVVDFRNVYSLPIGFVRSQASKNNPRIRLSPPYREHLSQAFARFFMRVGLPVDIPPFTR